jgi:hypothetical protein
MGAASSAPIRVQRTAASTAVTTRQFETVTTVIAARAKKCPDPDLKACANRVLNSTSEHLLKEEIALLCLMLAPPRDLDARMAMRQIQTEHSRPALLRRLRTALAVWLVTLGEGGLSLQTEDGRAQKDCGHLLREGEGVT